MLHSWNVQMTVYAALTADTTLMAGITGVFDSPDQNQPLPYITLGESTDTPDDLLVNEGGQCTLTIHVWAKAPGMKRLKEIMDRVSLALHRKTLSLPGTTQFVDCKVEFSESFQDPGGESLHGVQRCRVRTFEPVIL